MHAETLREALRDAPFEPCTVHTVSGAKYLVAHPDFALLPPSGRTVHISLVDGEGERVHRIDTALIERIEPAGTAAF